MCNPQCSCKLLHGFPEHQRTNCLVRCVVLSPPTWCHKMCLVVVLHGQRSIINIAETEHREMDGGRRLACDTSKRALQLREVSSFPPVYRLVGKTSEVRMYQPTRGWYFGLVPLIWRNQTLTCGPNLACCAILFGPWCNSKSQLELLPPHHYAAQF